MSTVPESHVNEITLTRPPCGNEVPYVHYVAADKIGIQNSVFGKYHARLIKTHVVHHLRDFAMLGDGFNFEVFPIGYPTSAADIAAGNYILQLHLPQYGVIATSVSEPIPIENITGGSGFTPFTIFASVNFQLNHPDYPLDSLITLDMRWKMPAPGYPYWQCLTPQTLYGVDHVVCSHINNPNSTRTIRFVNPNGEPDFVNVDISLVGGRQYRFDIVGLHNPILFAPDIYDEESARATYGGNFNVDFSGSSGSSGSFTFFPGSSDGDLNLLLNKKPFFVHRNDELLCSFEFGSFCLKEYDFLDPLKNYQRLLLDIRSDSAIKEVEFVFHFPQAVCADGEYPDGFAVLYESDQGTLPNPPRVVEVEIDDNICLDSDATDGIEYTHEFIDYEWLFQHHGKNVVTAHIRDGFDIDSGVSCVESPFDNSYQVIVQAPLGSFGVDFRVVAEHAVQIHRYFLNL